MNARIAEAVGDVMLLLHTRVSGAPAPLLESAIVRLAREFAEAGASRATTIGVLQGLVDQAVASADLTQRAVGELADELQRRALALGAEAYDAVYS